MIIDARNFVSPEYGRVGSLKAVINHAIDGIEVGSHIHVDAMKDEIGSFVQWARLGMYVSALKGDRKFKIRKAIGCDGYDIYRIA